MLKLFNQSFEPVANILPSCEKQSVVTWSEWPWILVADSVFKFHKITELIWKNIISVTKLYRRLKN